MLGYYATSTNSPAISRFTRCTVPLPHPTSAATFRMPFPARSTRTTDWFGSTLLLVT
jgi:hypothetical protein